MSRICPECSLPLHPFAFHGVALDECRQCGGIWFDDGELQRCQASGTIALLELEDDVKPEIMLLDEKQHERNCPVCNLRLRTYKYLYTSDIMLDECNSCYGVWVQDGELQKMADFLDGERMPANGAVLGQAKTRAEAAGLVAALQQQSTESRLRTSRIVGLWRTLARRPSPFARTVH